MIAVVPSTADSGPLHAGAEPSARSAHSVSRVVERAAQVLRERAPTPFWVRGEVSGWKRPASGHCFFTLKDERAEIQCVLWSQHAERLPMLPENGMQVDAYGRIRIWALKGQFRFEADQVEATGRDGLWQLARQRLEAKLRAEGLLDEARKRPLPSFPERVGIVTSPHGAVIQDMYRTLRRKAWWIPVLVSPCAVEGEGAAPQIAAALRRFGPEDGRCPVDLVLIARGGGSPESLWAFNTEQVVRAIAECPVPTVSAVGHETDWTTADLVADLRAATPTAGAERAVPDGRWVGDRLEAYRSEARSRMLRHCGLLASQLEGADRHVHARSPVGGHRRAGEALDRTAAELERTLARRIAVLAERLTGADRHLNTRSPLAQLATVETRLGELVEELTTAAERRGREVAREVEEVARDVDRLMAQRLAGAEWGLAHAAEALDARSPVRVLARGYALATHEETGAVVRDPAEAPAGTPLRLRLAAGDLRATSAGAAELTADSPVIPVS